MSFIAFLLASALAPPPLHSFPTRRSSDLFSAYLSVPSGRRWNHSGCSFSHGWSGEHWIAKSSAISIPTSRARATSRSKSRSEEHTSELQSHVNLVCRLLLEKKKTLTAINS